MRFLLLGFVLVATSAFANEPVSFKSGTQQARLIELFTSQGCSSCPPAERWLSRWVDHPDLWRSVVPVAFHVDYWDQLGWRDPFATARFSTRQRDYYRSGNVSSVYTPGFVVNGQEWRGYYKRQNLPAADVALASIEGRYLDNHLDVLFSTPHAKFIDIVEVNVALLGVGLSTAVRAGENRRKTLDEDFVVLHHQTLTLSQVDNISRSPRDASAVGQEISWSVDLPSVASRKAKRLALAVWAEHPVSGKIVQAVGTWISD